PAIDGLGQELPIGRHDQGLAAALERNLVPGLDDLALVAGDRLVVVEPAPIHLVDGVAVIVEFADRDHLGERGKAALVVAVEMADENVVDLLQARILRGRKDSFRSASGYPVSIKSDSPAAVTTSVAAPPSVSIQ